MQQWNNEIRSQLNDLPGFPPAPTGSPAGTPATDLEWILGDWIQECRLRPAAATFAALPATANSVGDIRASLADQAWFIWDGAVWQPMAGGGGGVVSVTGAAPISSTGGFNPVISLDNSGVVAATYGDATNVAQIAVDAKGRITSASSVAISMPSVNVGLGNVAVGDGTGITGSTDLSFVSNVLEVNSQINVTNGGNTLTVQPASIGSDAATLTLDAGTTVQVGGVALVNISGAFALPGVDGANGQVLTTDGAGTASWQTPLTGITGSGANGYLTLWNGTSTVTGLNPATTDGLLWTQNSSTFNSITVRGGGVALINAAGADQVRLEATGSIAAPADAYRALTAFVRSSGTHSTGLSFRRASGFPAQEYPDWFFGNVADSGAAGRSETGKLVVYSGNNTTSPPDGTRSFVAFRWESGATAGEVVFNETLRNHDFNIKGTTDANLFVADASANAVGIGTSNVSAHLFNVGSGASANFAIAAGGFIHTYGGGPPNDGELLIGHAGNGRFQKNTLTAGSGISITNGAGSVTIAATGAAASTSVDIPSTAQEALLAGDLVRFVDVGGTPSAQQADATNSDARLNPVGFAVSAQPVVGGAVTVRVSGVADVPQVQFVDGAGLPTSPTVADVGRRVFMSPTSGKITLTAPTASGDVLQRAGVLVDGSANPKVLVQIGDPVLL